jgi:hypothetical protein
VISIRKWLGLHWLALTLLGCLPYTYAHAKTERLTFDAGATVEAPDPKGQGKGDPRPRLKVRGPDGKTATYALVVDKGTPYRARIDTDGAAGGKKGSLALTALPSSRDPEHPEHRKDKVQLHLDDINDGATSDMDINSAADTRYVGFDMKLDPSYENPPRGSFLIHFQAHQERGGHPPFAIWVRPTQDVKGPVTLELYAVDDAGENHFYKDRPENWRRRLYSLEMERGRWYRLVVFLQPAYNGSGREGRIGFWVDGDQKLNWTGDWGFRPGESARGAERVKAREKRGNDKPVENGIQLGLGIYRSMQQRTQTVYFNNVVIGNSYASVASR